MLKPPVDSGATAGEWLRIRSTIQNILEINKKVTTH